AFAEVKKDSPENYLNGCLREIQFRQERNQLTWEKSQKISHFISQSNPTEQLAWIQEKNKEKYEKMIKNIQEILARPQAKELEKNVLQTAPKDFLNRYLLIVNKDKELNEKKKDDMAEVSETMPETDESSTEAKPESKPAEKRREPFFHFNLFVPVPSGSLTVLRCISQGEIAARINKEVQEQEVIEVRGYLRNEKDSRQILVRVVEFAKLDISFEKISLENSNQVRLLGKIVSEWQFVAEYRQKPEVLSFKLAVPREGVRSPLFFCRINEKELVDEFNEKLQK
ncbi:15808_t:CDS:2, partial [Racocetra persica]